MLKHIAHSKDSEASEDLFGITGLWCRTSCWELAESWLMVIYDYTNQFDCPKMWIAQDRKCRLTLISKLKWLFPAAGSWNISFGDFEECRVDRWIWFWRVIWHGCLSDVWICSCLVVNTVCSDETRVPDLVFISSLKKELLAVIYRYPCW
jgi:hypothetical protein